MHARQDPGEALQGLIRAQGGVIAREQALRLLPERSLQRLVDTGRWTRISPGLYTNLPLPLGFHSRAWAGVLAAGDGAMLGEHAAGHQLGLCEEPEDDLTVLVPAGTRRQPAPGCRHVRRRELPRARGSLPTSPPETTVLDLCALAPERSVEWVTEALRLRLTTPDRLERALSARRQLRGGRQLRVMLTNLLRDANGLESTLEHRYAVAVEQAHGLPRGRRQQRRGSSRHDVAYEGLLVELDGRLGHEDARSSFRDMARDNDALLNGLPTLRYGHQDCWHRPCEVAAQVNLVLTRIGHQTTAHACPSCSGSALWPQT
ncbi:type IV toxin-antitoxin system AbiEi family antitoxin domain-containing protein [Luteococcus sp. Sow4_B9]|uniref:type IV toxin-antitoxin system AbiEi family antitoxin domain-containing protein n=1 Tax=Luteococcus sp. Sow4_B9 TaxID=3438792 RepID=UPI003F9815D8